MTEILKVFIQLFLIIDPFNVVPIFSMVDGRKVKQVARDAVIVAFSLLLFFAILGDLLLRALDISLCSFMIAGGILLLSLALEFIKYVEPRVSLDEFAAVPIGTPLLAGPGAITMSIILMRSYNHLSVMVALAISMFLSYLILRLSPRILGKIGKRGVRIVVKVMGLLLAAIAIEFILKGASTWLRVNGLIGV